MTDFFKIIEGVKPAAVTVRPHRLDRVTADNSPARQFKRTGWKRFVRTFVELAENIHLTLASGTRTTPAETFKQDEAFSSVVPFDGKFISNFLNVEWSHE